VVWAHDDEVASHPWEAQSPSAWHTRPTAHPVHPASGSPQSTSVSLPSFL